MRIKREVEFNREDCEEILVEAIKQKAVSLIGALGANEKFVVEVKSWGSAVVSVTTDKKDEVSE